MKNRKLFKSLIFSLLLILPVNFAFADSCIMISPENITKVDCQDQSIVSVNILSTLMNDKKSLIVTSLKDGCTSLKIKLKNKTCDYQVRVNTGKLEIKGDKTIKVLSVDLPPEVFTQGDNE